MKSGGVSPVHHYWTPAIGCWVWERREGLLYQYQGQARNSSRYIIHYNLLVVKDFLESLIHLLIPVLPLNLPTLTEALVFALETMV